MNDGASVRCLGHHVPTRANTTKLFVLDAELGIAGSDLQTHLHGVCRRRFTTGSLALSDAMPPDGANKQHGVSSARLSYSSPHRLAKGGY